MGGFISFLNENAGAFAALAAILTAVATGVIAWFSWGTWRLYRREERRFLALDKHIHHEATHAWVRAHHAADMLAWLRDPQNASHSGREHVFQVALEWAQVALDIADELVESARPHVADSELMERLNAAHVQARFIRSLLGRFRSVESLNLEILERLLVAFGEDCRLLVPVGQRTFIDAAEAEKKPFSLSPSFKPDLAKKARPRPPATGDG